MLLFHVPGLRLLASGLWLLATGQRQQPETLSIVNVCDSGFNSLEVWIFNPIRS